MGGDEPDDCSRRINFARQNADDRHFLLVGKDVAEIEQADLNLAAEETLLCGTHGAGATRAGWVKTHGIGEIGCVVGTDPALSSDLVADPEIPDCFRRPLPGSREFGVLISDGLRRQERFFERRGRGDVRFGPALRDGDGCLIARHQSHAAGNDSPRGKRSGDGRHH